ncbi:MAG: hypothetical protein HOP03_17110 [Lysobacter sp.]|nr:hypothetical protein [Lysobacter sp.]
MSIVMFENGPYVNSIGWTNKPDHAVVAATKALYSSMVNPVEFDGAGGYRVKDGDAACVPTDLPLPLMRSSGVARARSAAKSTIFAALLGKELIATVSARSDYNGDRTGVAVASSTAITPIAWEFETVGLHKGWSKTDTMLLPSSIPSAITTQTSAVFDTHAAAIAFQDGAFGVCAAIEHAYLSFAHNRSDYFLVIGSEEICGVQCDALDALNDDRPRIDGASGLVLGKSPCTPDDWRLAFCFNAMSDEQSALPGGWGDAEVLDLSISGSATVFTATLVPYALHQLFERAGSRAVLVCSMPERGKYFVGFERPLN